HYLDKGKTFRDGRPVFGKGKTWEGSILGIVCAVLVASIMQIVYPFLPWGVSAVPLTLIQMGPLVGALLGLGAIVGDLVGSFFKRRLGLRRGHPAPVLDQLDFIVGSFVFVSILFPAKVGWLILLAIITPFFHLSANYMAFLLGVKKEPY
ncbi:MAG TPA: CDP-2,3-bis-(O-geranylgeranyl)-sn-glycerol synthase, partial [archaeon]|nr:CDP-2,3-bis-(O-geranylgeranyl)-sn-glycerol synthase [archaeon]